MSGPIGIRGRRRAARAVPKIAKYLGTKPLFRAEKTKNQIALGRTV